MIMLRRMPRCILAAIATLATALACATPAQAQSNGYYRLRNKATGEYAMLASDVLSYNTVLYDIGASAVGLNKSGARATMIEKMGCYLRHDIRMTTAPETTPASVFYVKKHKSNEFNLLSEGANLYDITEDTYTGTQGGSNVTIGGFYTNINSVSGTKGLYTMYIPVKFNSFISLGNFYFRVSSGNFGIEKDAGKSDSAQWYLEPATTFQVAPLAKVKDRRGHYYTTLCVDFPFSIPTSGTTVVAAYTVTGKDADGYAVLNKLSGTIAGGTPVVIECSSSSAETNILNIETATQPAGKSCANGEAVASDGNYLQGRYFNAPSQGYKYYNTYKNPSVWDGLSTEANVLQNNKSDYRVLNCVDGVVGFYKLKSEKSTMGANKAFLNIKDLPTVSAPAAAKMFRMEDAGTATGIETIEGAGAIGSAGSLDSGTAEGRPTVYYDLQGRRVTRPTRGIYIVNGRKMVVR